MDSEYPNTPSTPRKISENSADTPRKHKSPSTTTLQGLRTLKESVSEVKTKATRLLRLSFEMDEWQAQVIHRLRQRYDSILIAGTGYGKSLIFQGLAALDKKRMVIVISPLKALERDQVTQ